MNNKIGKLIVTMFGVGLIKYFPGTFASFITAAIYYFFYTIKLNYFLLILINLFLFFYSVWMINNLEGEFSEIDSKEIVIDEFLGQSVPILFFYIIFYEGSVSNTFFLIIVFLLGLLKKIVEIFFFNNFLINEKCCFSFPARVIKFTFLYEISMNLKVIILTMN